jgi:hypothetical protein
VRAFHRIFFAIWLLAFPARNFTTWVLDQPNILGGLFCITLLVGLLFIVRHLRTEDPPAAGIRFMGGVQVCALPVAAGARCLVCRSELAGEIIYCASCHTPHHRECFAYAGACSVYACRGREFRRAA